jgi:hypothetical protein
VEHLSAPVHRRFPRPAAVGTAPDGALAAALAGATGWLNSPPLTAPGLRSRVVLVEFLTYTGVNWIGADNLQPPPGPGDADRGLIDVHHLRQHDE